LENQDTNPNKEKYTNITSLQFKEEKITQTITLLPLQPILINSSIWEMGSNLAYKTIW